MPSNKETRKLYRETHKKEHALYQKQYNYRRYHDKNDPIFRQRCIDTQLKYNRKDSNRLIVKKHVLKTYIRKRVLKQHQLYNPMSNIGKECLEELLNTNTEFKRVWDYLSLI